MASVFDVANWFLSKEPMTPKKVQKLCYYYKAWSLALYDEDFLPGADFQAWIHGPVCPELYQRYKDYGWNDIPRYTDNLFPFDERETDVLDSVWVTYGEMSANALEAQTHSQRPWQLAREGYEDYQNCEVVIKPEWMRDFYKQLYQQHQGE